MYVTHMSSYFAMQTKKEKTPPKTTKKTKKAESEEATDEFSEYELTKSTISWDESKGMIYINFLQLQDYFNTRDVNSPLCSLIPNLMILLLMNRIGDFWVCYTKIASTLNGVSVFCLLIDFFQRNGG